MSDIGQIQKAKKRPSTVSVFGCKPEDMSPAERAKAITGYQLRHRIEALVSGVTQKKIKHHYYGDGACTNDDMMVLPSIPQTWLFRESDAKILLGYTAHEISHHLETPFDIFEQIFTDPNKVTKAETQLKNWWNAIEDYRIEKLTRRDYPGFPIYINETRRHSAERFNEMCDSDKVPQDRLANPYAIGAVALTWVGERLNNYPNQASQLALQKIDPDLRVWVESWQDDLARVEQPEDSLDLARRILADLQSHNQDEDQQDDQNPSDKGDQSNSQCNSNSSGDSDDSSDSKSKSDGSDSNSKSSKGGKSDDDSSDEQDSDGNNSAGDTDPSGDDPADKNDAGEGGNNNKTDTSESGDSNNNSRGEDGSSKGEQSADDQKSDDQDSDASGSDDDGDNDEGSSGATGDDADTSSDSNGKNSTGDDDDDADDGDNSHNDNEEGHASDNAADGAGDQDNSGSPEEDGSESDVNDDGGADDADSGQPDDGSSQNGNKTGKDQGRQNASSNGSNDGASEDASDQQDGDDGHGDEDGEDHSQSSPSNSAGNQRPKPKVNTGDEEVETDISDLSIEELLEELARHVTSVDRVQGHIDESPAATKPTEVEANQQEYARLRAELGPASARSAGVMRRLLQSQANVRTVRGLEEGALDLTRLVPIVNGSREIYSQQHRTQAVNTAVSVMLDNSGSMAGAALEVCQKAAIVLDSAITGTGTDLEVNGFTGSTYHPVIYRYRSFGQKGRNATGTLGGMQNVGLGGTPVSTPMLDAWRRLKEHKAPRKILIVISDGEAEDPQRTREVHDLITFQGGVVVGIAIGSAGPLLKWCNLVTAIRDIDDLPKALTSVVHNLTLTRQAA